MTRSLGGNPLWRTEFLQGAGQIHGSVRTLSVLQQRNQGATHRHRSSVQRMHGFWSLSLGGTVPTTEASCLVTTCIGAACHLPIASLARYPGLAIELASGRC